ncbi:MULTISPECIES: hypothetical protein [Pseudomonas]|uniref:hypothetical protein n=1 Tax=Pseudomonas TaxID=286 RepID=UPI000519D4C7|nr:MULTISPECIES: hypothetical protein [Pseudomonas]QOY71164.1 hypothetical protein IH404_26035 [Pseudomonas sp. OST1909]WPN54413.1 hypothetical protein QMK52_09735 [Pseudomonas sp. P9_2]
MSTGFFSGIKSLSVAQGTASFEILIDGRPAPTFTPNDFLATPGLTQFYGEQLTQFHIRYRKSLGPGDYKLDASELGLAILCRDHNYLPYARDERAEGQVIVSVERTGIDWRFKGSVDITYPRPLPIIRVKGTYDVSFLYE